MVQHILLLLIAPAFLLLSCRGIVALAKERPRFFCHPLVGWIAGVGAMWLWHAPALCNAAVSSRPIYALQSVSLLVVRHVLLVAGHGAARAGSAHAARRSRSYLFTACDSLQRARDHSHFFAGHDLRDLRCNRSTGSGCCDDPQPTGD